MYLLSQLWWYLTLAFLLGALLGYFFWRACSRPMLETNFARTRRSLNDRIGLLENQRTTAVADAGTEASAESAKLRSDLAALKTSRDEFVSRANTLSDSETRLKSQLGDAEKRLAVLQADVAKARSEAESAHAADLKKVREAAEADAARKHAEELNKAREAALAEWSAKHAADVKKARDEVSASLTASHAAEIKKARESAEAEAARKHADDLKKAREAVAAEWASKHAQELKQATDRTTAEWKSKHEAELKKAREEAVADAPRRHADDISRLKRDHDAALAKHAADFAQVTKATLLPESTVKAPAPLEKSAPTQVKTAPTAKHDDLELIWGVGPGIAKLLNSQGVTRFEQIANWSDKDIARLDSALPNFKGRATSEKWVDQAKKLASGWRPEREIGDRPQDILTAPRGGQADDLKLIWGVGPKLEQMLNEAGFYHFDQIATWTDKEIAWVDTKLGEFAGRAVRDRWVEQCKKLASGWRPESDAGEKKPH